MGTEDHPQPQRNPLRKPLPPAKLTRLDRLFEAARQKASGLKPNYDYASELFVQCVLGDPGNDVYIKAYIENLQKKFNNNRSGAPMAQLRERSSRSAVKKALAEEKWDDVIEHGVKVLAVNPWDVPTLTSMAQAARKSGDFECEMYFLKNALTVNPKDPAVNRLCAIAATERQLIDQAIHCWHQVEEAFPFDEECKRAIAILQTQRMRRGGFSIDAKEDEAAKKKYAAPDFEQKTLTIEERLRNEIVKDPKQLSSYIELSEYYLCEERFGDAEEILAQALEISDGDPDMHEKLDEVKLRGFRHKLINTTDPEQKKLLQNEYYHKELEYYKKNCARYPSNLFFRYDLGLRYMLTKQYNKAIPELQAAKQDPHRKGVSLLALGQCFQQIKQYRLALNHYQMAVEDIPDRDAENKKEAMRLTGKLALGLGEVDLAEKFLTRLAALDFTYKDVSGLLDKTAELRKNQLSAGKKPNPGIPPEEGLHE
jgi:tetratricopeptide (TPR) repeat protein